jgi:1-phosphofructokinase
MICTVTLNPAVDQTLQFEEAMAPDRVMRATDARFDAGGKGINVAQFLTALNTPSVATGVVGGFTGQFIRERLDDADIPTAFVDIGKPTRLNTSAIADGTEYKLNHDGPAIDDDTVAAVIDRVGDQDPDRVLVGGSLPPGVSTAAVDAIASAGDWDTVVDMDGHHLRALDANYALCKPNREELAAATDHDVSTVEACARAAGAFRSQGFDTVLASLGGDGAVLATESELLAATPLDVDVVDTVGAGDALLSGALAAWADGEDDARALKTGIAVASRVVARAGTAVPELGDIAADRRRVAVRELDH